MIKKLNRWLCQNFDEDKKGYVEISDVICVILNTILTATNFFIVMMGVVVPILIGTLYYLAMNIDDRKHFTLAELTHSNGIIELYIKLWLVGIIAYLILYIMYKISKLRIAKCELKKNN